MVGNSSIISMKKGRSGIYSHASVILRHALQVLMLIFVICVNVVCCIEI